MRGRDCLLKRADGVMKLLQRLDTEMYQVWQKIKKLTRRQKQFILGLLLVCLFFLCSFFNAHAANNASWLEGSWSNQSVNYSIKAKNDKCKHWNIKQNGYFLMKDALISTNSSKKRIILARDGCNTEYHIIQLSNDQLELQIFNNQKKIKGIKLTRMD